MEPLGDRCILVTLGDAIDDEINRRVHAVAEFLLAKPIPGVLDVVPAFTTVAIHYRPEVVGDMGALGSPHDVLAARLDELLAKGVEPKAAAARVVDIPVCYGGEFGPDLEEIAASRRLSVEEAIAIHANSPHVVHMIGFSPGLPYIAGLDKRLDVPRRATPRVRVPPGTVAIAAGQTVIYPLETPGGWSLIGRTPLRVFSPDEDPPCLLSPRDRVRFVPISREHFETMRGRS